MLVRETEKHTTLHSLPAAENASLVDRQRFPSEYQAWLLDLDGTLYRQSLVRVAMSAELLLQGWLAIRILRNFRNEHEQLRAAVEPPEGDPYLLQIARTARKLEVARDDVAQVVESWMISRPGKWLRRFARSKLLHAIRQFRENGGRTAIVSDYPASAKLESMDVASLFDEVVACGELGGPPALKPHPNGLLLAAERLGIAPCDCLVIGDRWDADGEAARRAGMDFRHVSMPLG